MNLQLSEGIGEILQKMFENYLVNPGGNTDVSDILTKHQMDLVATKSILESYGLSGQCTLYPGNKLSCSITLKGIDVISDHVKEAKDLVISYIGMQGGGEHSLSEIINAQPGQSVWVMDLADYLENELLIEDTTGKRSPTDVYVSLSNYGFAYYQQNQAIWNPEGNA